ncbi:MAG: DUF2851 family protein [Melioribacteraceae bacterium]
MNDKNSAIREVALHEIWKRQSYKSPLKTLTGEEIKILDAGVYNEETDGPDFKNARIRIGNFTYAGDIEIDRNYNDWKTHGHNIDSKYSKVVLHATLINQNNYGYVYTRDGRKITSICLSQFIEEKKLESLKNDSADEKMDSSSNVKCSGLIQKVSEEAKEKYLRELGNLRFEKKCKKIHARLKELQFIRELDIKEPVISYDLSARFLERKFNHSDFTSKEIWQQLFYELIFEALGYSKNKLQMLHLARAANVNFLGKIENDGVIVEKYEAALLFISGLMNDPVHTTESVSRKYLEKISLHWNSIRPFYDGKYFETASWHFFRLRPQNFPTVRIAGGARLLAGLLHKNLIPAVAKKITEIHNFEVLIKSLRSTFIIKAEGFWKNHYVLDQTSNSEIKYFVGVSRADEIVVNVVLPFFAVYFDMFEKKEAVKKLMKLYNAYEERSDNQLTLEVAQSLNMAGLVHSAVLSQGMIELFRTFCSRSQCLECEIGKSVFN